MSTVVRTILLLLLATSIAAAESTRALQEYMAGQELFQRGEFVAAAARFQRAYDFDRDPTYLYNLAQSLRLAKECERAAAAYRTFLAEVRAPPNRARVEQYIAEMDACAQTPAPAPLPPPAPEPPPTRAMSKRNRNVVIGLGVGGVVGIAVGVAFIAKATELEDQREALCQDCTWDSDFMRRADDLDDRGARASFVGITSMLVGTALVASGGYLYWKWRTNERAIAIGPTARGITVIGRF